MELSTLKEIQLSRGAIIEFDLYPNDDRTREAHLGYFLEVIEDISEYSRNMNPNLPKVPFIKVADPELDKNWCPKKIHQIPLEDICNIFYHGKSHYFG